MTPARRRRPGRWPRRLAPLALVARRWPSASSGRPPRRLAPLALVARRWPSASSGRPPRRSAPALATVLVVVLVAGACGTSRSNVEIPLAATQSEGGEQSRNPESDPADSARDPDAGSAPAAEPDPSGADPSAGPAPAPAPAEIAQSDCPLELAAPHLACALATVPVDWENPSGAKIEISLAVLQGTGPDEPAAPPLVVLQGGPGSASTDFRFLYDRRSYPQVFIDQRGTGFGSVDFDCPEINEILAESLGAVVDEAVALGEAAYQACGDRLSSHPVLARTNSAAHAADAAAVMAGLGYDRWFVYGVSYGTTIALELVRTGPAGLAGAVLDGVYPPGLDVDRSLVASAQSSLQELDAACAADPACSDILADLDATLVELMARLDDRPLVVTVDATRAGLGPDIEVLIDGATLAQMVFLDLYTPEAIATVPGMLAHLDRGDEAAAVRLGQYIAEISIIDSLFNAEGTYLAVQCAERLPLATGVPSGIGAYEAAIAGPGLAELCIGWDLPPSAPDSPVVSDLPALLLAGRFDPITPPRLARQAAAGLSNSTVVVRDGASHGIWPDDPCAAVVVDAFLADPAADLDTSCAADPSPIDWQDP